MPLRVRRPRLARQLLRLAVQVPLRVRRLRLAPRLLHRNLPVCLLVLRLRRVQVRPRRHRLALRLRLARLHLLRLARLHLLLAVQVPHQVLHPAGALLPRQVPRLALLRVLGHPAALLRLPVTRPAQVQATRLARLQPKLRVTLTSWISRKWILLNCTIPSMSTQALA